MKWANVRYAVRLVVLAIASRGPDRSEPPTGKHGPAPITETKLTANGSPTLRLIERRALMISNRNREQAARYLEKHMILGRVR